MKIANIDWEILHIFWTTWGISMKFSGKMWPMIKFTVTKNQPFTLFLEDTFFGKPQEGGHIDPPPAPAVLGLEGLTIMIRCCTKNFGIDFALYVLHWSSSMLVTYYLHLSPFWGREGGGGIPHSRLEERKEGKIMFYPFLTLSWRRSLSYRKQSIDLKSKPMNWFLYNGLRHERVNYLSVEKTNNKILNLNWGQKPISTIGLISWGQVWRG